MRKYIIITFLLIFTVNLYGYPLMVLSANDASFTADTTASLSIGDFTIASGSQCDQIVVGASTIQFVLSPNSNVHIRSTDRYLLNNDGGVDTNCGDLNYSQLALSGPSSGTHTVTVTPSTTTCEQQSAAAASGVTGTTGTTGGAVSAPTPIPTAPTTSTGEVTVTASEGGKTTLTTEEATIASVDFPVNAVSASTDVSVVNESKTEIVATRAIPSGKSIVGSYAYNFTATANETPVANFSEHVTITLSYTDTQISGFDEDALKIYYWDGSQWLGLETTIDKTNNQVSAITNHFTYFAIFGESETPSELTTPEAHGLTEGNLIRAEGDFDIFIINQYGYKRLFLNPAIFEMYGHLGSWDDVITVTPETRDAFITSSHYRYVNEDKVYHLEVTGEDTGTLQWINMAADDFLSQGGTANGIFTINKSELDWYPKGADRTSL
jgi:hypothetical protein